MRASPVVVLALAVASPAAARTFHSSLACVDCHVREDPAGADLVGTDTVQVCLRCHGGSSEAPDVLEQGTASRGSGTPRAAGGLPLSSGRLAAFARGDAGPGGHALGSMATPPGFVGGWSGAPLACKSCHDVHPNGNYRNLRRDLFVPHAALRTPSVAEPSAVEDERSALTTIRGHNPMNAFCASCHSTFHGRENTESTRGRGHYVRHPTTGVPLRGRTRATFDRLSEPLRVGRGQDGTPEAACVTCHRAHGTRHVFALVFWDRTSPSNAEDGAGDVVEGLCRSCHDVDDE